MFETKIPIPIDTKVLIFDFDGTLVDSMPLHFEAYNFCLKPYGIQYNKSTFLSRGGIPDRETLQMIAQENQINNFDLEEALEQKRKFVDNHLDKIRLIEPIMDIIREYHNQLPLALGTGTDRETVDRLFEILDLKKYFSVSVTATEVSHYKPHPETYLRCAELLKVSPGHCFVFEDGAPGIQAAKSAGMSVVDINAFI